MSLNRVMGICGVGIAAIQVAIGVALYAGPSAATEIVKPRTPYFTAMQMVDYPAPGAKGGTESANFKRVLIVSEHRAGACLRVERLNVNFVKDGTGYFPEYTEARRHVSCPLRDTPEYEKYIKQLRKEFAAGGVQGLPSKS